MTAIFAPQDRTGTVAYFVLSAETADGIVVGDTGVVAGNAYGQNGIATPVAYDFTVLSIGVAKKEFSVTTSVLAAANWPEAGATITWKTGTNAADTSTLSAQEGANAYITVEQFMQYHDSRGNSYIASPREPIQEAIVKATDYLDQRYQYKGVKQVQAMGNPALDPNLAFIDPFLSPYGVGIIPFMAPSTTSQSTQWPRAGVVDFNGDNVYGIPHAIMAACAELALRSLSGTDLQPDFDGTLVANGGVVSSITEDVGPIKQSITYDTRQGLGFFASFPQVDRILAKAGLLLAGGGRTILR